MNIHEKKISVIVPLYNTEKYISRCLDSIINQTHKNIEIIVVNDFSRDKGPDIVLQKAKRDSRIKMINHDGNKGLYHARITGVENSTGDYIGFVDSDDYISRDYFRVLLYEAEEASADIVVGKIVHEDEAGYRYVHNLYDSFDFGTLNGKEIPEKYWEQEGRCFIWHTVWNKLYARNLWTQALPVLKKQKEHLIMTEDFVFSSVIMNFARRLTSVEYASYYYFQHSDSSTGMNANAPKFRKNISDISAAFNFVEQYIASGSYRIDARENFIKWKRLYNFFWRRNIENSGLDRKEKNELYRFLESELHGAAEEEKFPDYFYHVTTAYDGRYNELTDIICLEKTECVSFDIFDTLLVRPFYDPHDLFTLLNKEYSRLAPYDKREFSEIRDFAERQARRKFIFSDPPLKEEITLNDIYDEISDSFGVEEEIADKMKTLELNAEMRFCARRESVRNLYRLALSCGKAVFFVTDTYFDRPFVDKLLKANGYTEYSGLLISSEENLTKRTGRLFDLLIKRSGCEPGNILHIGDNPESDAANPKKYGINAYFYPKYIDCIQNNISGIQTTHSCGPYKEPSGSIINYQKSLGFFGNRTALALAAMKLYDNPFISYNGKSEANACPQFLGYYMLGMHLLGFVKWIIESSEEKNYDTLSFISRDGWLPMKAYEIIRPFYKNAPGISYIYTSRKAAIPCGIENKSDLLALFDCISPDKCTPGDLARMLSPVLDDFDPRFYRENGIEADAPIATRERFNAFIGILYSKSFSKTKAKEYTKAVAKYFDPLLSGRAAVVDIGYSGRTQEMLVKILGRPVDAFYIHTHNDACNTRQRRYGFKVNCFYDFTPSVTGAARELMFSRRAPSCTGYDTSGGTAKPLYEKPEENYPLKYLTTEIQNGALKYIEDFARLFGRYGDIMAMRNMEVSYPFEYFLHTLTDIDARMFECVEFEDDMWAGGSINLESQWKKDIAYHKIVPYYAAGIKRGSDPPNREEALYELFEKSGISKKGKPQKALFWLIADKKIFLSKLKEFLRRMFRLDKKGVEK